MCEYNLQEYTAEELQHLLIEIDSEIGRRGLLKKELQDIEGLSHNICLTAMRLERLAKDE